LFNSIICKAIAGKRINLGARGSYNARVAGAVVQHNTQQVLTEIHKGMNKSVPSIVIEKVEKRRQIKVARTRESREINRKKKKLKKDSGTDCYYGPQSQKPDLPDDIFCRIISTKACREIVRKWKELEAN